jgi:hypothetical protein
MMILKTSRSSLSSNDQLSLDLPFAETKSLTARVGPTPTFSRASTGTFVGSDGLIQSAAINTPRFDHDSAGVCRGLLIEESRTNLLSRSENFGTTWAAVQLNTTGTPAYLNVATAPDGNTTADKLIATTTNSTHQFRQDVTLVSGTSYTISVYFKAAETNFATISVVGAANGNVDWVSYFNISASSPAAGQFNGFARTSLVDVGNGWRRCSVTFTATASGTLNTRFGGAASANIGSNFYAGDGTSGFLLWGAQLEAGSFATSYIPTTTSSVVRSADVCSITGANFTGFYNPVEGSLATSAIFNAPVAYGITQAIVDINDTTTANRLRIFRTFSSGFASLSNTSNSTPNVAILDTAATQPLVTQKFSSGFKLNDYAFYVNNAQIGTDNLGAMPISVTTFTIGDASAGFSPRLYLNGTIAAIRYYRKRLPNAKLQALTA